MSVLRFAGDLPARNAVKEYSNTTECSNWNAPSADSSMGKRGVVLDNRFDDSRAESMPSNRMSDMSNQPSPGRLAALLMIGFGFLALGVAFMLMPEKLSPAASQDFSTIPVEVNLPAPELSLVTLDGTPAALSDYLGKVVLVNLWATWCPPCRDEMPTLQAFYEKYKERGFVLIAIDQGETEKEVVPFAIEFGLSFPVWLDPSSSAGNAFNTMNLPSSYVIDGAGRIRLMWIGGISKKNLEKFVPDVILEDT